MKKIQFLLYVSVLLILLCNNSAYSQAGSVELQDGSGGFISSHSSIEEAYAAIPGSITGAYIIEILAAYTGANEVFPIDLTFKTGHSDINTITIRPDAGNTGEVISSGNTAGIMNISDADYIIIDGRPGGVGTTADLEIRNTATTGTNSNTISLLNGATNCVVRYCKLFNATQGTAGPRTVEFGVSAANISGNSDNTIENCLISGGRSGFGSDGTAANPNRNNRILNNTITDFSFAGIWLLSAVAGDYLIEGNTIDQVTGYNVTNPTAINIGSTSSANVVIRKNKIMDVRSSSTATGLIIRSISTVTAPSAGTTLTIENNFISQTVNNNNVLSTYGILLIGTVNAYTANINYNTILMGGTQTTGAVNRIVSAGIINNATAASAVFNIKNNIVINTRSGGTAGVKHTAAAYNDLNPVLNLDYNIYLATAVTDGYTALVDSTGYNAINDYKAAIAPNESHTRFKNVDFVSSTDLHLTGASIGDVELAGMPIAGITTDIDGDTRSSTHPYRGADESTALILNNPINVKIALQGLQSNGIAPRVRDTVTVLIRETTPPYPLLTEFKVLLDSAHNGTYSYGYANLDFNWQQNHPYYIEVMQRQSILAWSNPVSSSTDSLNYDFTSAVSQTFGNNAILVNGAASLYTGDIAGGIRIGDGCIDLTDILAVYNESIIFAIGPYVLADLNYDGIADLSDIILVYNNATNFVCEVEPPGAL